MAKEYIVSVREVKSRDADGNVEDVGDTIQSIEFEADPGTEMVIIAREQNRDRRFSFEETVHFTAD